jgi:hypothetical protein
MSMFYCNIIIKCTYKVRNNQTKEDFIDVIIKKIDAPVLYVDRYHDL